MADGATTRPPLFAHPRRKLSEIAVRSIRSDYRIRREAEEMVARGKALLMVTPTCNDHARSLDVSFSSVLNAAQGRTYRDVEA